MLYCITNSICCCPWWSISFRLVFKSPSLIGWYGLQSAIWLVKSINLKMLLSAIYDSWKENDSGSVSHSKWSYRNIFPTQKYHFWQEFEILFKNHTFSSQKCQFALKIWLFFFEIVILSPNDTLKNVTKPHWWSFQMISTVLLIILVSVCGFSILPPVSRWSFFDERCQSVKIPDYLKSPSSCLI